MTIIFDIDGTLTKRQKVWDEINPDMVNACKDLISKGHNVIVWSRTRRYAKAFCDKYNIKPLLAVGKPQVIVDNQKKKWGGRLNNRTVLPEDFLKDYKEGKYERKET
jgi:hydroxymethylpyrimidine pyrophosphatase-like HAD family hydrolase